MYCLVHFKFSYLTLISILHMYYSVLFVQKIAMCWTRNANIVRHLNVHYFCFVLPSLFTGSGVKLLLENWRPSATNLPIVVHVCSFVPLHLRFPFHNFPASQIKKFCPCGNLKSNMLSGFQLNVTISQGLMLLRGPVPIAVWIKSGATVGHVASN
jgi:hypothetical protein